MKKEFQIFKEGVTTKGKITILSDVNTPFNRVQKIAKYLWLGYRVFSMNGEEIKSI